MNNRPSAKFLQSSCDLTEGTVFRVPYPFYRSVYHWVDEDGPGSAKTWRPGGVWQLTSNYGESDLFANGVGEVIYEVVSIHKPAEWPTRIFFTRKWQDPDGRVFGKRRLHVCVQYKFSRWVKGYPEDYTVEPDRDLDKLP